MAAAMACSRCVSATAWRPPRLSKYLIRFGRRCRPPNKPLEYELHRPLHDARGHAASAGGVEGRGVLPEGSGIRRQTWRREVRIIEHVERFEGDVEVQTLEQSGVLRDRKVLIEEVRSRESVVGDVAETAGRRLREARRRLARRANVRAARGSLGGEESRVRVDKVNAATGLID